MGIDKSELCRGVSSYHEFVSCSPCPKDVTHRWRAIYSTFRQVSTQKSPVRRLALVFLRGCRFIASRRYFRLEDVRVVL